MITAALRGARDTLPVMVGGIPFGFLAGVAASQLQWNPLQAVGASVAIFAGAAQLASYELIGAGAPALVILLTAVIINLRFALYSAALAPSFAHVGLVQRLLMAYLLTDQAYALNAARLLREPDAPDRDAYYLGSAGSLWLLWILTTFTGAMLGAALPPEWKLEFAVPACFIALLVPAVESRSQLIGALVTAAASLALRGLPSGLGLISSIGIGLVVGMWLERKA